MKTLQITSLLAAVALSSACHHRRPTTHERVASVDPATREGAKQMEADIERDTKEAGNGATKAADDLDAALEGRHDVVGNAADDANDAANQAGKDVQATANDVAKSTDAEARKDADTVDTVADKAADATKKEVDADTKTAATAADKATTDVNAAAKDAKDSAKTAVDKTEKKVEPTKVAAEIETIDRHSKQITFRVRDEEKEISLQAGREMKVEFSELPVLTGMKVDEAISKMHEGENVDLRVLGSGENAKVVKVGIGDF